MNDLENLSNGTWTILCKTNVLQYSFQSKKRITGKKVSILKTSESNKKSPLIRVGFYINVSPEGFEPSTASLEGRCSIQLSYEPNFMGSS